MYAPKPDPDDITYVYLIYTFVIIGMAGCINIEIIMNDYHYLKRLRLYINLVFFTLFFSPYILFYFLRK